ncbi:MAG TPA: hypothetical protein VNL37_06550 [Candidatus Polarisedimenticolia bacterium]|nr:hypothetical protein [Candidatus Polarisedimenticolia bacterium]
MVLLGLGVLGLAAMQGADTDVPPWAALILLPAGAGCAWLVARYGFARLVLDERGFALVGPLGGAFVAWSEVEEWTRWSGLGGPPTLHVVHGAGRRRLSVPLIYEESHILEVGLHQRGFPRF